MFLSSCWKNNTQDESQHSRKYTKIRGSKTYPDKAHLTLIRYSHGLRGKWDQNNTSFNVQSWNPKKTQKYVQFTAKLNWNTHYFSCLTWLRVFLFDNVQVRVFYWTGFWHRSAWGGDIRTCARAESTGAFYEKQLAGTSASGRWWGIFLLYFWTNL